MLSLQHIGTARAASFGAQVLQWQPPGVEESALYLSPNAVMDGSKAIRGGIPVCFPWFGPRPNRPEAPSHGWCRTQHWTHGEDAYKLEHDGWSLRLKIEAAEQLTLSFAAVHHDPGGRTPELAFHAYLAVSDISLVQVEGLLGRPYLDQLVPASTPRPIEARAQIRVDGEVDRIYGLSPSGRTESVRLIDTGLHRTLTLHTDLPSTVLWNPWVGKSRRLADLPDDAYRRFICIESGVIGPDAREVGPGETFGGSITYDISPV